MKGGLQAVGYSSTGGWILQPAGSVEARKHVGERTWVSATAQWMGHWNENAPFYAGSDDLLWPSNGRWSWIALDANLVRQLGEKVALHLGAGVHQLQPCLSATCAWSARGGGIWLGPSLRPVHWLTLSLHGYASGRYRPAGTQGPIPPPDQAIAALPPRTATWLGLAGFASFHW